MRPTFQLYEQFQILKQWLNVSTPTARNIVRSILKENGLMHSHELFAKTQEVQLDPQVMREREAIYQQLLIRQAVRRPPNPLHPIRSLSYLKTVVMPDLEDRKHVVKIVRRREPTPEEREIIAHTKPLSLSQRKRRGALGPGRRPPLCQGGMIKEWLWEITEEGRNTPPEKEMSDLKLGLVYDERRRPPKPRPNASNDFFEPKTPLKNNMRRTRKESSMMEE